MSKRKVTLRAKSLTKKFGAATVLSDIDLQLHTGEWLGILGESGSGKSTLLRILARFADAEEGNVFFKEEELKPASSELIPGHHSIRLIHQEFELFPNQTVEENIAYSLRFTDAVYRLEKVAELLSVAGLDYVKIKKPSYFPVVKSSGLQLQKHWPSSPMCCFWMSHLRI